jgi:hypothetical protein
MQSPRDNLERPQQRGFRVYGNTEPSTRIPFGYSGETPNMPGYRTQSKGYPGEHERIQRICHNVDKHFRQSVSLIKQPILSEPFKSFNNVLERLLPYHLLSFNPPNPTIDEKWKELEDRARLLESRVQAILQSQTPVVKVLEIRLSLEHEHFTVKKLNQQYRSIVELQAKSEGID